MPKLLEKMKLKIELYFTKKKMDREHFKLVDSPDYGGRTHYDADPIKYEKARRKFDSLKKRLESFDDKKSTPVSKVPEKNDLRARVKADVKPLDASGIKTDVDPNKSNINNREIVD